jgi:CHASE3 domain sensor protein
LVAAESERREQTRLDFTALLSLSSQKLNELVKTIDLARSGHLDQALAIVRTSKGKELMDQIRARATDIEKLPITHYW